MTFRADGNSVIRSAEDGDVGVALAFDKNTAQRIADALNSTSTDTGARAVKDPLTGEKVAALDVRDRTPLSNVLGEGQYVKIVGPYATAEMNTPSGRQIRSLAEGSVLPSDASAGTARHLIDVGLAQLVEAGSAAEVFEGAPTERHRVEATALTGEGPTVGHPREGTVAHDYDRDPEAAARAAAAGAGPAVVVQTTGAGEGVAGGEQPRAGGRPGRNDSKAAWVDWAVSQRPEDVSEEDARAQAEAKSKADLVAEYGG